MWRPCTVYTASAAYHKIQTLHTRQLVRHHNTLSRRLTMTMHFQGPCRTHIDPNIGHTLLGGVYPSHVQPSCSRSRSSSHCCCVRRAPNTSPESSGEDSGLLARDDAVVELEDVLARAGREGRVVVEEDEDVRGWMCGSGFWD